MGKHLSLLLKKEGKRLFTIEAGKEFQKCIISIKKIIRGCPCKGVHKLFLYGWQGEGWGWRVKVEGGI